MGGKDGGAGADTGAGNDSSDSQSYILERSTVDIKEGWMETESRNLDWTRVLSVVERQVYRGKRDDITEGPTSDDTNNGDSSSSSPLKLAHTTIKSSSSPIMKPFSNRTDVTSTVTLLSRLGQTMWKSKADTEATRALTKNKSSSSWFGKIWGRASEDDDYSGASSSSSIENENTLTSVTGGASQNHPSSSSLVTLSSSSTNNDSLTSSSPHSQSEEQQQQQQQQPKQSLLRSWSTASLQRSIEIIGLKRAYRSQPNAKEGMEVVLDRLRQGGLVAVLEGMRRDRELVMRLHYASGNNDRSDDSDGAGSSGILGRSRSRRRTSEPSDNGKAKEGTVGNDDWD